MKTIKVMIVEDDSAWKFGLAQFLKTQDDLEVVATCSTKEEALQKINEHPIDVILMDIHLANDSLGGLEATLNINYTHANTKIIMLSSFSEPHIVMEAMASGAKNFIVKKDYMEIPRIIREVHLNISGLHPSIADTIRMQIMEMRKTELKNKLSKDEIEYMLYLDQGLSYGEIAEIKIMDPQSVKNKFYRITKKLGWHVKSYKDLVDKAKKFHLLS